MYLDNTMVDDRVITGQNAWSTWSVAEAMVRGLGHEPVRRDATSEELAVRVLDAYHRHGQAAAARLRGELPPAAGSASVCKSSNDLPSESVGSST